MNRFIFRSWDILLGIDEWCTWANITYGDLKHSSIVPYLSSFWKMQILFLLIVIVIKWAGWVRVPLGIMCPWGSNHCQYLESVCVPLPRSRSRMPMFQVYEDVVYLVSRLYFPLLCGGIEVSIFAWRRMMVINCSQFCSFIRFYLIGG